MSAVKLHAISSGDGPEQVILLHGLFGMADNLAGLARELEADYRVHRLDLRNHGRSPHTDTMSLAEMADDLCAFMDQAGIERAHLLGHSLGGKVVMELALTRPQRVASLVVADIAPVIYEPHHGDVLDGLQSLQGSTLSSRREADERLAECVDDAGVRQFLLKNLQRDEEGLFRLRLNLEAILECYHELRGGVAEGLYSGPTLFIKGEHSDYILAEHEPVIRQHFPAFEFRMIGGTGHWLHAEKPRLFNRLVREFLNRQSAAS